MLKIYESILLALTYVSHTTIKLWLLEIGNLEIKVYCSNKQKVILSIGAESQLKDSYFYLATRLNSRQSVYKVSSQTRLTNLDQQKLF